MASRSIRADNAHVTTSPAPQDAARRVFAMLGHDGTGDLIEALLAQMDAYDGDIDREDDQSDLEDGDVDCCGAGDDQGGRFGHFGTTTPRDDEDCEPDHDAESDSFMAGGGSDDRTAAVAL